MKSVNEHINTRLDRILWGFKHYELSHHVSNHVRDIIWNQVQIQIYRQIKQDIL